MGQLESQRLLVSSALELRPWTDIGAKPTMTNDSTLVTKAKVGDKLTRNRPEGTLWCFTHRLDGPQDGFQAFRDLFDRTTRPPR